MNISRKFYMCGSFYLIVEADSGLETRFRLPSVKSLSDVKKAMTRYGFKEENWYQPHSSHENPISSFWIYRK